MADGAVKPFEGDLDDYKQWAKEYHARSGARPAVGGGREFSRKEERRAEAQERQRQAGLRKPFEKRIAAIEGEMEPLTREAAQVEAWLAGSEAYEEAAASACRNAQAPRRSRRASPAGRGVAMGAGGDG